MCPIARTGPAQIGRTFRSSSDHCHVTANPNPLLAPDHQDQLVSEAARLDAGWSWRRQVLALERSKRLRSIVEHLNAAISGLDELGDVDARVQKERNGKISAWR